MKTSPIHDIHKSLSAKFVEINGWEVPAHYGNPVAEHLNVRNRVGIMDASHRGKVRISGKDRTMFLQKILSQDITKLTPNNGAYSTLLDVKGRLLAYMRIYCDADSFLIDVEPGLPEKMVQTLTHYLFREDVIIEDVTEKYGLMTIQGPLSKQVLSKVTDTEIRDMPECSHRNLPIKHVSCKVVRTSYTGEDGYDIYALWDELPDVWRRLVEAGKEYGIMSFGLDSLETLRIEAGTPLYSIDMDEHTIPIEANLDKAISYDKGCYIGQETIARIKFRGHVNKTLTGFYIHEGIIPQRGDKLYKVVHDIEHPIGFITSSCLSPTFNKTIALGYIRIEYSEPGEEVYTDKDNKRLTATVAKLPFYPWTKK